MERLAMRTLNVRFLLVLLGLGTVMAAGAIVTHTLQTGRIAGALLARASAAEEQGQPRVATLYLSRYLEFRPADIEQRARLGRLLATPELADSPRGRECAVAVLEQVLGRDPDRRECRRLLVRLALESGNREQAREHLKILCESATDDAETEELRGRLYEAQGQFVEAVDWYRRAFGHDPGRVDVCARLADLLRRHPAPNEADAQAQEADRIIEELVAKNGRDPRAFVIRWRYRNSFFELKKDAEMRRKAAEDVARARELAPDDAEATVAVAQLAQLEGRLGDARAALKESLEQHPQDVGLYRALAALEMEAGERKAAANSLRVAVKKIHPSAQPEFLWALAHLLIDGSAEDRTEAADLIAQMRKSAGPSATTDYLQARLLMVEGKPTEAARLLERARPILGDAPEVGEQIDLGLGRCYEQLADPARQKEAYDRLAGRAVKSLPALLGLAAAEASLGNLDTAITRYREAAALQGAPPEAGYALVHLLIIRNRERGSTDWTSVTAALRDVEKAQHGSAEAVLLRAEALAAQDKLDEARQELESACAGDSEFKQSRLRLALAAVLARQNKSDQARRVLDETEKRGGDTPEMREALASFWAGRPREEAAAPLARLSEGLERWGSDDRSRILRAVAEARVLHGDYREAEELCARIGALPSSAKDIGLRLLQCELSAQTGNAAAARSALDDLRRIEGAEGAAWCYAEAVRLTAEARRGQADLLPEARRRLDQAASQRPGWTPLVLAKAEVAELQNRPEDAIAQYKEAMRLGERGERISRRLVELLYRQQRYREAQEEIAHLRHQGTEASHLELLEAELSLHNRDPLRAAQLALRGAPTGSKDYRDVLWLGQILAANPDQANEAEAALRRALAMEEKVPETWVALIQFLAVRGKTKEAQDILTRAESRLDGDRRPLALAPCYEAVGLLDRAQEQYREALRTHGNDVGVLRTMSGFYLRWLQPQAAEPLLRRIIDRQVKATDDDVAWARLGLSVVLATRGDYPNFLEALGLVGLKMDGGRPKEDGQGEDTIERRRARAHVLATRAGRALQGKAIDLLEELDGQQGLYPGDRYLLAQLYEVSDAWPKAEEQLRRLSETYGRQPAYLAHFAENLLHQDKPDGARPVVERLETLEKERQVLPGAFGSVELRARLLEATGAGQKAVALLSAHAAREGAAPEDVLLPISSLVRQKQFDRALELMERAWRTKCPPEVLAGSHLSLLRVGNLRGDPIDRAEGLVRTALASAPRNAGLLFVLAGIEDLRGRFPEAEAYYRRVIAVDGNNVRALNNLAWLLALRNRKGEEALPLIQRAIDVYGPRPDLLDTRALVYLAQERADRAREDLKTAIDDTPTATRYLHLARVCEMAGDVDGAAAALKEAKALGLKRAQLHPVELAACTKLLEGVD
jgi:cellulose synthase operon protein C